MLKSKANEISTVEATLYHVASKDQPNNMLNWFLFNLRKYTAENRNYSYAYSHSIVLGGLELMS